MLYINITFIFSHNKKINIRNDVYELLQCKKTQKICILRRIFVRHVNKFFMSCLFFIMFFSTFGVKKNLRDEKIIYDYKDTGWV